MAGRAVAGRTAVCRGALNDDPFRVRRSWVDRSYDRIGGHDSGSASRRMRLTSWRFVAVVCTAVTMSAGFTHLLELPRKITLGREQYLMVQQLYRGWAWLSIVVVGALISTIIVARRTRDRRSSFTWTVVAALSLALSLIIFFLVTYPANQQTQNWTVLPENCESLRRQWEYSHAAVAGVRLPGPQCLTLSLLVRRTDRGACRFCSSALTSHGAKLRGKRA
jgi:hypothetical protein